MKLRAFGWVLLVTVALVLPACRKEPAPADIQKAETAASETIQVPEFMAGKVEMTPGIDKTWPGLKTLAEQVEKDFKALQGLFIERQFTGMGQFLKARFADIAGPEYEILREESDVNEFWAQKHTEGAALELKLARIYITNEGGPYPRLSALEVREKPPAGKRLYDAVAFASVEIHIVSKDATGETLHNATYTMSLLYRHQWCCVWGPEDVCE
jgi:hypothetical protein